MRTRVVVENDLHAYTEIWSLSSQGREQLIMANPRWPSCLPALTNRIVSIEEYDVEHLQSTLSVLNFRRMSFVRKPPCSWLSREFWFPHMSPSFVGYSDTVEEYWILSKSFKIICEAHQHSSEHLFCVLNMKKTELLHAKVFGKDVPSRSMRDLKLRCNLLSGNLVIFLNQRPNFRDLFSALLIKPGWSDHDLEDRNSPLSKLRTHLLFPNCLRRWRLWWKLWTIRTSMTYNFRKWLHLRSTIIIMYILYVWIIQSLVTPFRY